MGLWDKFRSDKKSGRYLGTGTKIRRIRSQKDTTVVELANALGVNEAAIRNYEIGYRQASRDKLELIAQRLGVPVETLIDRQIDSYNDAIHILFELSEKYDLVPKCGTSLAVATVFGLILTVSHKEQIGELYPQVLETLVNGTCRELF